MASLSRMLALSALISLHCAALGLAATGIINCWEPGDSKGRGPGTSHLREIQPIAPLCAGFPQVSTPLSALRWHQWSKTTRARDFGLCDEAQISKTHVSASVALSVLYTELLGKCVGSWSSWHSPVQGMDPVLLQELSLMSPFGSCCDCCCCQGEMQCSELKTLI